MNIGREVGVVFAVRLPVVALQVLQGDRQAERPAETTAQPAEATAQAAAAAAER